MWRVRFWHGRWGTLAAAAGALAGGLALVLIAPTLTGVVAGLVLFGTGMGITYYAALYYSLAVGHAAVDAGGTFEALIGLGYFVGPADRYRRPDDRRKARRLRHRGAHLAGRDAGRIPRAAPLYARSPLEDGRGAQLTFEVPSTKISTQPGMEDLMRPFTARIAVCLGLVLTVAIAGCGGSRVRPDATVDPEPEPEPEPVPPAEADAAAPDSGPTGVTPDAPSRPDASAASPDRPAPSPPSPDAPPDRRIPTVRVGRPGHGPAAAPGRHRAARSRASAAQPDLRRRDLSRSLRAWSPLPPDGHAARFNALDRSRSPSVTPTASRWWARASSRPTWSVWSSAPTAATATARGSPSPPAAPERTSSGRPPPASSSPAASSTAPATAPSPASGATTPLTDPTCVAVPSPQGCIPGVCF